MGLIFGVFALCFGLRGLYGYYLMKTKRDLSASYLLPKDVNPKDCKDLDAYCRETQSLQMLMGVITVLYGIMELYNSYVAAVGIFLPIMLALLLFTLIIVAVLTRKYNYKYFDLKK